MEENEKIMNEQEIIKAIIDFNNDPTVQKLQSFYYNQTVPEIFGVSRSEASHSTFLAWLFNPTANHGLGSRPLIQLLELYLECYREQEKSTLSNEEKLQHAILTRNIEILSAEVKQERFVTSNKKNGRADIDICCDVRISDSKIKKLHIVIENKVYSKEHDEQTETYFNFYDNNKAKDEVCLYIYLTPSSTREHAKCKAFVHITYQHLLDHILERLACQYDISERTQFILNEYIAALSIPTLSTDNADNNIKKTTIMAIGKKEQNLLIEFWEKNKQLINAACSVLSMYPEYEEEVNDIVKRITSQKDDSKYSINNNGRYNKSNLAKEVVLCYLKKNKEISLEELKTCFPDYLQGSFGVIRELHEIKNYEKNKFRWKEISFNGQPLYITTQWGAGQNAERFISYVNDNIKGIEIAKIE